MFHGSKARKKASWVALGVGEQASASIASAKQLGPARIILFDLLKNHTIKSQINSPFTVKMFVLLITRKCEKTRQK